MAAAERPPDTTIRPIDAASVHRICSGQVVLDLAGAVKELVENALDAGATTVEVRLKEHGSELVEVSDNGCGVAPASYEALTAKYHTSKMSNFADLTSLTSFGFRGEALSSLCALCDLSVVTRTSEQDVGTRIEYDHEGRIKSTTSAPRAVGTTVVLKDLFKSLPVRHKDFLRNVKREFGKLLATMQAYALICVGVRLVVTHTAGRAPRATVVHTQGGASLRDNIVTVLGAASAGVLQPFSAELLGGACTVTGFVSTPAAGSGRSAGDRQFFYVNGRPVDLPRVAKTINDVYRAFNAAQVPAAVLDFKLATDAYDVNVTPDKRRVMLHAEDELLGALRDALTAAYEPSRGTLAVGEAALDGGKRGAKSKRGARRAEAEAEWVSASEDTDEDGDAEPSVASMSDGSESGGGERRCSAARKSARTDGGAAAQAESDGQAGAGMQRPTSALRTSADFQRFSQASPAATGPSAEHSRPRTSSVHVPTGQQTSMQRFVTTTISASHERRDDAPQCAAMPSAAAAPGEVDADTDALFATPAAAGVHALDASLPDVVDVEMAPLPQRAQPPPPWEPTQEGRLRARLQGAEAGSGVSQPQRIELAFDLQALRASRAARRRTRQTSRAADTPSRSFAAASLQAGASEAAGAASTADADVAATAELERSFKRSDFAALRVAGQFNLGFILAVLGDDLFIVDQHASDEIYNFERLRRTTVLNKQPLIAPQLLDLSPAEQQTVLQHADTFRANGFEFEEVHAAGELAPQLRLTAVPFSKNTTFGPADVQELLALLDGGAAAAPAPMPASGPFGSLEDGVVRPSRVRSMLAMRACRCSIMIGRALDTQQMERVLQHLSELKAPWNCPHGRPTMRHLADLRHARST